MNPVAHQNRVISINNNCGNVTESNNNVWNNCNISVSDEKRQILEWLSPLASRERHQAVRDSRADGVGDWLLRTPEFSTWRALEDRGARPVLLCYGDPGVGKTYMRYELAYPQVNAMLKRWHSSLVIDTLCDGIGEDNVSVTYVYCDFSAPNAQSANTVLGSLLRQVVGALTQIPDIVQKEFERVKRQVDGCGLRLPEIVEMLIKCLSCLKWGFTCIDALDEFPMKCRPQLWESLQHVVRQCPNTRLFVTGRPHIRDEIEKYFSRAAETLLITPKMDDIRLYLKMRLERDLEFGVMDDDLRADIFTVIPASIAGMFVLSADAEILRVG